jgi:deazaflavin-dependent oxidoreductase (nitroreductase family)
METDMITATSPTTREPRFGGILWRLARRTTALTLPFAGQRWNPVFAVLQHRGRQTGRHYEAPVAARRVAGGFVVALAFGAQVDWYRNLVAAGGGSLRWRGGTYAVGAPVTIDPDSGVASFHLIQRAALRLGGIDAFIRMPDAAGDGR